MKTNLFRIRVFGAVLMLAAIAFAACTKDAAGDDIAPENPADNTQSVLMTAKLSSFASSPSRVVVEPQTKAYPNPGSLTLYATIKNLSAEEGKINGFVKEEDGRYLSATCVYFNPSTETYYVTYHMQGNNYKTKQNDETSGYIETFKLAEDGTPIPGIVYQAANPAALDFDFNHLFFDDLSNTDNNGNYTGSDTGTRIIAVGHKSEPSSKVDGEPNTAAIIAKLDLENEKIEYATVYTGEKILDENGKSLGKEDAGDVNCVIRKYNYYYLATRKGIAVLNAKPENMFTPINNVSTEDYLPIENSTYFVRTPGSAKHLANYYPAYGSGFSFLYLTEEFPEGYNGETKLPASLINFSMNAGDGTLCGMNTTDSQTTGKAIYDSTDFDIASWSKGTNQFDVDGLVCPIDGKNVVFNLNGRLYACLGKGGLYVRKVVNYADGPAVVENTIKFSDVKEPTTSRPVNGVFVEDLENFNDGFIYVANGACLTILDRETLEKVAEFSAYDSKENEHLASANYVHVYKTGTYTGKCPDRLVTVAYGQAGVKVFKFTPPSR